MNDFEYCKDLAHCGEFGWSPEVVDDSEAFSDGGCCILGDNVRLFELRLLLTFVDSGDWTGPPTAGENWGFTDDEDEDDDEDCGKKDGEDTAAVDEGDRGIEDEYAVECWSGGKECEGWIW